MKDTQNKQNNLISKINHLCSVILEKLHKRITENDNTTNQTNKQTNQNLDKNTWSINESVVNTLNKIANIISKIGLKETSLNNTEENLQPEDIELIIEFCNKYKLKQEPKLMATLKDNKSNAFKHKNVQKNSDILQKKEKPSTSVSRE